MENIVELHDSRISGIDDKFGEIIIIFTGVYLYSENKGWSQNAKLIIENGNAIDSPSTFPVTISEGEIEVEEIKYINLLEIPFIEKGNCEINFTFTNGECLKIKGKNPRMEVFGEKAFIEDIEQP